MKINKSIMRLVSCLACVSVVTLATNTLQAAEYNYTADNWSSYSAPAPTDSGNTVSITGVTDATAWAHGADGVNANSNKLNISDSTLGYVYAGRNGNNRGTADGNTVTVSNSSVISVHGGFNNAMNGSGISTSNNTVIIENSTVSAEVIGGHAIMGTVANNTVILKGSTTVAETVYGVYSPWGMATTSDNTLQLVNFTGSVGAIANFDAIEITASSWDGSSPLVNITNGSADLKSTQVVKITLESFDAQNFNGSASIFSSAANTENVSVVLEGISLGAQRSGAFLCYTLDFNENLELVAGNVSLNPQTKALSEGRVAAMVVNNRAGNLVAESGMEHAAHAAEAKAGGEKGLATFFALSGGHEMVESGSHVDVNSLSSILGVSCATLKHQALTLGGFIESGWGQYSSQNHFVDAPGVLGEGESSYAGAGVLARYAFKTRYAKTLTLDASLRAGRQETDFSSADLNDGSGCCAAYDIDSAYIAGHVGVSSTHTLREKLEATLYARYLWSHLEGANARVCGESVKFDSMNSHRLRFGGRTAWQISERWKPYAGLAFEWECSGNAHASTSGMEIATPSLRGGSVVGEVGSFWQPSTTRPLWVEAAVQGSAGKNQGIGARLGCSVAF